MAKRHERTYARKQAIQVLYQAEILDVPPASLLQEEASFIDGAKPSKYAQQLIGGVQEARAAIDSLLEEYSENWTVERMPSLDRAVLRLACYEMACVDEVPVSVAINEAVDLAKEFGGEDESHRFVNGVLGRIADYLEEHDGALPTVDAQDAKASEAAAPEAAAPAAADPEVEAAPEAAAPEAEAAPEATDAPEAGVEAAPQSDESERA